MEIRVDRNINILGKPVRILAADTGDGYSVTISGGDRGHIGAVGIASPETGVRVITFPEHKETVIAEKWAGEICRLSGRAAVVSAGIHFDNINKEGIETVLSVMDEELSDILKIICAKDCPPIC